MSLGFGTSFWWVLVLEQWSNSKKKASIMSSSRWFLRMSRIILYMASGITSHVLAEETLPPTNVHSGNPVADGQAVPFKPHDLHALCWRNNHLTKIIRLNLLIWASSSFNWVYWEIRRCAPRGDIIPPDLPLSDTSMTHKPGDNRPCSL